MSRALIRVRCIELAGIGASDRRATVRAQLLAWAPFDDSEYRVVLGSDAALAVAWDRSAVRSMLAQAGAREEASVEPELWLREPMASNGVRVIEALEGVDAQWWRDGSLAASRWWPQRPDDAELRSWLRALGPAAAKVESLPPTSNPRWLRRPGKETLALDDLASTTSRLERIAVNAAAVVLVGFSAAQGHQLYAAHRQLGATQALLDRAHLDAGPAAAARDRARELAREADALAGALNAVVPLDVLQHLADVLPPGGIVLRELDLAGEKLRLALELPPQLARGDVVRAMQSGGWFTRVAESAEGPSRGWTQFDVELSGLRPRPRVTSASPASAAGASGPGATR